MVRPVYSDGPLKGIGNGDRMFKLELRPNSYLGTYHLIDGQKITARYPGQQPTCARCFGSPQSCPGRGMAKRCEQEGGSRNDFREYISQLWESIGYVPSEVELDSDYEDICQTYDQFTPVKPQIQVQDTSKYAGVRVSSFPKNTDDGQIIEFLINSGMPESFKENVAIKPNGTVMIEHLPNEVCLTLIEAIHSKFNFGKKLYCNGVVPCTPQKVDNPSNLVITNQVEVNPVTNVARDLVDPLSSPSSELDFSAHAKTVTSPILSMPVIVPGSLDPLLSPMSPNTFSQQYSETPDLAYLQLSNKDFVRRNSLSLLDRTPPHGSNADEIINSDNASRQYSRAKSIISNIKELTDRFSDFASCESLSDDTYSEIGKSNNDGFQIQGRRH